MSFEEKRFSIGYDQTQILQGANAEPPLVGEASKSSEFKLISRSPTDVILSTSEFQILSTMMEAILPETETPGASSLGLASWVMRILSCGSPAKVQIFRDGISWLESVSRTASGVGFVDASPAIQEKILNAMKDSESGAPFFNRLRNLCIYGYSMAEVQAPTDHQRMYRGSEADDP